jgi:hypothetical protein
LAAAGGIVVGIQNAASIWEGKMFGEEKWESTGGVEEVGREGSSALLFAC